MSRFDSAGDRQELPVAQLVEQEPLHGEGPNTLAGKTKPMVRVHPGNHFQIAKSPNFAKLLSISSLWRCSSTMPLT